MEFEFRVDIIRKSGILDPEGDAIKGGLNTGLNLPEITSVKANKCFWIIVDVPDFKKAFKIIDEASRRFLANPVYQEYRISPKTPPKRKYSK